MRICNPFWNVYIRNGFVIELETNAHKTSPIPDQIAIVFDSVWDSEK